MSALRRYACIVGLAAILGAFLSSTADLRLYAVDRNGQPIACGSALLPDLATANAEDALNGQLHDQNAQRFSASRYGADCGDWIARKRGVALATGVTGALLIAGAALVKSPRSRSRHHGRVGFATDIPPFGDQPPLPWAGVERLQPRVREDGSGVATASSSSTKTRPARSVSA